MGLKQWWADQQQDERERYYYARAGQWANLATTTALALLMVVYFVQGRLERVFELLPVIALGQVVYFGLLLKWRVTR